MARLELLRVCSGRSRLCIRRGSARGSGFSALRCFRRPSAPRLLEREEAWLRRRPGPSGAAEARAAGREGGWPTWTRSRNADRRAGSCPGSPAAFRVSRERFAPRVAMVFTGFCKDLTQKAAPGLCVMRACGVRGLGRAPHRGAGRQRLARRARPVTREGTGVVLSVPRAQPNGRTVLFG